MGTTFFKISKQLTENKHQKLDYTYLSKNVVLNWATIYSFCKGANCFLFLIIEINYINEYLQCSIFSKTLMNLVIKTEDFIY